MMENTRKGILAGLLIALGGHAYLTAPDKIVGAFLFSIGLLTIVIFNCSLCTGKMCFIESYKKRLTILSVLMLNTYGAVLFGLIDSKNQHIATAAVALANTKLSKPLLQVFIDGIICTLFIGIGVRGYKVIDNFMRYLLIIMAVMGFILSGAEHIVANLYYFTAAAFNMDRMAFIPAIEFLMINLCGNLIGGMIITSLKGE